MSATMSSNLIVSIDDRRPALDKRLRRDQTQAIRELTASVAGS
jgi:hypothetical protein